ncbi:MAG TPA: DUF1206 domain-containing protein [Microvirga sp.]|jgi:hypothetical protein|nr:DUF1206 domain-containing protein [Microvirga sp.]
MSRGRNPIELTARCGYGARGVVYGLVGSLALLAAIGSGGQTGGSRSALQSLVGQPFGRTILVVIAVGLAGFAAWRVLEALTDADRHGTSWKGLAVRGAHLLSGAIYAALSLSAVGIAFGASGGGEDATARDWTAWLLAQPFGQWLVGLAGLAIGGTGLGFLLKAWRGDVTRHLACDAATARWAVLLGRLGYAARGVVFLIIGGFVVLAALHSSSSEVMGLGGALQTVAAQTYGSTLLALVAIGLFAFGVFGIVQALYRRIDAPDFDDAKAAARDGIGSLTG